MRTAIAWSDFQHSTHICATRPEARIVKDSLCDKRATRCRIATHHPFRPAKVSTYRKAAAVAGYGSWLDETGTPMKCLRKGNDRLETQSQQSDCSIEKYALDRVSGVSWERV